MRTTEFKKKKEKRPKKTHNKRTRSFLLGFPSDNYYFNETPPLAALVYRCYICAHDAAVKLNTMQTQ